MRLQMIRSSKQFKGSLPLKQIEPLAKYVEPADCRPLIGQRETSGISLKNKNSVVLWGAADASVCCGWQNSETEWTGFMAPTRSEKVVTFRNREGGWRVFVFDRNAAEVSGADPPHIRPSENHWDHVDLRVLLRLDCRGKKMNLCHSNFTKQQIKCLLLTLIMTRRQKNISWFNPVSLKGFPSTLWSKWRDQI